MTDLPLKSGKLVVLVACFFSLLLSHLAFAIVFKPPNSKLFGYRQIAINGKYLWALPTPTTFEKVDQTFIFGTETFSFAVLCYPTESQLNHNFLTL